MVGRATTFERKIRQLKAKDEKIRDNNMFQEDHGNFYKSVQTKQEIKGKGHEHC